MCATNIDTLLKGVKGFWVTDTDGNRLYRSYKVHSVLNRELWDKIESIWGRNWEIYMRDVCIGNDYEVGGCYACVPEKMWNNMVEQMKERLFIVRVGFRHYSGGVVSSFYKEWAETKQDVVDQLDTEREEIVDWEVLEAEHNQRTRDFMTAEEIYNELKQA